MPTKWKPDPEQYRTVQLPGRPTYYLLKDREQLRKRIGEMIREHERIVARMRTEAERDR